VLEMVKAFERACDKTITFKLVGRRPGDIAVCYADPEKAKAELDWVATQDIDDMAQSSWLWQSKNPNGYAD